MLGRAGLLATLPGLIAGLTYSTCSQDGGSLYDFSLQTLDGSRNVSLSEYAGSVVLLVNVATYWGLARQYPDLNALREAFDGAMEIIGVPCSQFYNQEPGTPEEIMNALQFVRPGGGFVPNFPLFAKSDINGANRLPLYAWATERCESPAPAFSEKELLLYAPLDGRDIRWNYEKILFDRQGLPYRRYPPATEVFDLVPDIEALLAQQ